MPKFKFVLLGKLTDCLGRLILELIFLLFPVLSLQTFFRIKY